MTDFSRYAQQLTLPEIGLGGQQKLQAAKVLVVGAGGLGNPLAACLATMGVGTLGIIDGDKVEVGNLHRQFLFTPSDVGQNKAYVIQQKLSLQNPDIAINYHSHHLTAENAADIFAAHDIICDCTDNFETRYIINDYCLKMKKKINFISNK